LFYAKEADMKRLTLGGLFFAAVFLAAAVLQAQFVPLARCRSAYPCAFPFGLQYRPDALIAGQYGRMGNTGMAASIALKRPLRIEIDRHTPPNTQAIDDAVRQFLATHPPGKRAALRHPEEIGPARGKP
jgi:hypothetical protein